MLAVMLVSRRSDTWAPGPAWSAKIQSAASGADADDLHVSSLLPLTHSHSLTLSLHLCRNTLHLVPIRIPIRSNRRRLADLLVTLSRSNHSHICPTRHPLGCPYSTHPSSVSLSSSKRVTVAFCPRHTGRRLDHLDSPPGPTFTFLIQIFTHPSQPGTLPPPFFFSFFSPR